MGKARKGDAKPKREKEDKEDSDSSEGEPDKEEEEVETTAQKRKRMRGRGAFMGLLRNLMCAIPIALVLSRQPFVMRPREQGVNALKLKPLDGAICGLVHWSVDSPTAFRNAWMKDYINATGQWLLTPYEYGAAQQSKRAMPGEKTWAGAHKKAVKNFARVVDKEKTLKEIVTAPMPNIPLIGCYAILVGVLISPLFAGVMGGEGLIVGGCAALLHGSRQLGMEPQPELYVCGGVAIVMLMISDAADKAKSEAPAKKFKRK